MSPGRPPHVLDTAQIADLKALDDGAGAVFARVARLYRKHATDQVKTLRSHYEARDLPGLWQVAHALKGSSSNVGAMRVADTSRQIEAAAGSEDVAALARLVPALERDLEDALGALAVELDAPGLPPQSR